MNGRRWGWWGSFALLALHLAAVPSSAAERLSGTPAARAFERFRSLEGTWAGKSTKGWEDDMRARVIAGGSVVMMTSFDAHPGETMLTTVFLDGDDLMLVHYCVAGNQPRLRATDISEDGSRIKFTFADSTNLSSRDQGHMDSAVFDFRDEGRFTSRWTWYQDGEARWMEEIERRRVER